MKYFSGLGSFFVRLGRSLMLPIAVLPIAGILLRIGQPDIYNLFISETTAPSTVNTIKTIFTFIGQSGSAVFDNLPVIFAIGVAIGFAKDNHGAAGLAAFVGHTIFLSALKVVLPEANMGVLSGVIIGSLAGYLYNKYHTIELPAYLAFFGGSRFIPIITGVYAILLAVIFRFIWPPVGSCIEALGDWIIASGNYGAFVYGFANRLLLIFGLHHILNTLVWFQFGDYTVIENGVSVVKHGDLWRFFAGDKTAGTFMAGLFLPIMFGLPGAAVAMIATAKPEKRKLISGILISAILTAFITGITEPIEFSFVFVAFPLYVLHAILTGLAFVIANVLDVKLGFTFSAGLFDYILSYRLGRNGWMIIPVGVIYFAVYFVVFYFAIRMWNLKTPGREDDILEDTSSEKVEEEGLAYLEALGGVENIITYDACTTRLRFKIKDNSKVNEARLKALGAKGVMNSVKGSVQVIIGPQVELLLNKIKNAASKA